MAERSNRTKGEAVMAKIGSLYNFFEGKRGRCIATIEGGVVRLALWLNLRIFARRT